MKTFALPTVCRGLIFDMDNTLYSNAPYSRHQEDVLVQRLALELGMDIESCQGMIDLYRKEHAEMNGGRKPSLGNTFLHYGIPIQTSVEWRRELISPELFLHKDPALVSALYDLSQHFSLSVVTNNPVATAQKTFAVLGLPVSLFTCIIGLDTTGVSKPDPRAFILAAEKMCCPSNNCVSVGDRFEIDIEPVLNLGMGGILIEQVAEIQEVLRLLTI